MKKIVSLVLALVMVASLCTVALAEGSKSNLIDVTNASKSNLFDVTNASKSNVFDVTNASKSELIEVVDYTVGEAKIEAATEEEIAAAIEAAEDVDVDATKLTLVGMGAYTATEYPCTLTFYGEGTEEIEVVVLVKYEDAEEWTLVYFGLAGEFDVEVENAGTYAIYVVA